MKRKSTVIALAVVIGIWACSRQEGNDEQRTLTIDVQMESSTWLTRAEANNTGASNVVALDDQLEIVTEAAPFDEVPITRGTPVASASSLPSMGIGVYTNSTFTRTVTGTNSGGAWALADNVILDLDKNSYSYYAYSPVAAAATNGVTVAADSKSLTYTAPTDITKQPDLCWATPITGDKTGTPTFAMKHAMTAVGLKVRADNVEIQSVTLTQINSSGTLNLTNGAWSSLGTLKDFVLPLNNSKPSTGNNAADLTTANGFLMVPAQDITADAKKLVVVYRYTGESTWRTGTHSLKSIGGTTPWAAGQKVIYTIQLKAKFSLDLAKSSDAVSLSAGNYTLNYTTGSSSSTMLDPQVTCPEASGGWIQNLKVNRSAGSGTITFSYPANTTVIARKTLFTITSGFTEKYFTLTQLAVVPAISLSSAVPASDGEIPRSGGTYKTTVTVPTGISWIASGSGCSFSPSSGTTGQEVTISVSSTTYKRDVTINFSTNVKSEGISDATTKWAGRQTTAPDGCFDLPIPGYPDLYVYKGDDPKTDQYTAGNNCSRKGGRLPDVNEMVAIQRNKSNYGSFVSGGYYWTTTPGNKGLIPGNYYKCVNIDNGGASAGTWANYQYESRCVKSL